MILFDVNLKTQISESPIRTGADSFSSLEGGWVAQRPSLFFWFCFIFSFNLLPFLFFFLGFFFFSKVKNNFFLSRMPILQEMEY